MKTRHLILMLLKASGGRIAGKTKIQKEIYFLSLIMNKDLEFKPHYYGPYSMAIEEGLDELTGAGFVNMQKEIFGIDMNRGFELKRYDFSLSESGKRLADILCKENVGDYQKIEGFVKGLKEIDKADYLSLSIAAKAYFILDREGKPMNKEAIREKAKHFGWNIEDGDNDTAVAILKKLHLVEEKE